MSFDPQNPPPPKNPYEAPYVEQNSGEPSSPVIGPKPQVILWQKVYLGFMVALYVAFAIMGVCFLVFANDLAAGDPDLSSTEMQIMGVVYGAMGIGLALLFGAGLVFNKGNGGWIFNTVLIGIGLTSCCLWPATIPLFIYWIKNKEQIIYYS